MIDLSQSSRIMLRIKKKKFVPSTSFFDDGKWQEEAGAPGQQKPGVPGGTGPGGSVNDELGRGGGASSSSSATSAGGAGGSAVSTKLRSTNDVFAFDAGLKEQEEEWRLKQKEREAEEAAAKERAEADALKKASAKTKRDAKKAGGNGGGTGGTAANGGSKIVSPEQEKRSAEEQERLLAASMAAYNLSGSLVEEIKAAYPEAAREADPLAAPGVGLLLGNSNGAEKDVERGGAAGSSSSSAISNGAEKKDSGPENEKKDDEDSDFEDLPMNFGMEADEDAFWNDDMAVENALEDLEKDAQQALKPQLSVEDAAALVDDAYAEKLRATGKLAGGGTKTSSSRNLLVQNKYPMKKSVAANLLPGGKLVGGLGPSVVGGGVGNKTATTSNAARFAAKWEAGTLFGGALPALKLTEKRMNDKVDKGDWIENDFLKRPAEEGGKKTSAMKRRKIGPGFAAGLYGLRIIAHP